MAIHSIVVPLNTVSEAFMLFNQLLIPFVVDVRGERVHFDVGDYTHLMDDEERLQRIRWIAATIQNPVEIRRSHVKAKPFREVYIAIIRIGEETEAEPFLVGIDRRLGRLDFRTAFVPELTYFQVVRRGELLWRKL